MGEILKVVWVTGNCYKDFIVTINGELIFERTPVSMIKTVRLKNKSAYMYSPEVGFLKGGISIQGTGCNAPIIIYTNRGGVSGQK